MLTSEAVPHAAVSPLLVGDGEQFVYSGEAERAATALVSTTDRHPTLAGLDARARSAQSQAAI